MSEYTVEKVQNEPIIHVTIKGHLSLEDVLAIYQRSDELRKDMPKAIYRVTDVIDVETSFTDMMQILKQATTKGGSSSVDPTITVVFVGNNHWVKLFTDALRQGAFGSKNIPVYASIDEALAYVRSDMRSKESEG
jgi:hypothetical protein